MKTIYFNSSGSTSNSYISNDWTCNPYGNGSSGVCIQNNTNTGFFYSCCGSGTNQDKIWDRWEVNTSYIGNRNSVNYTSWTGTISSNYNSAIRNIDEAMRKLPESTPYVRPEFVPYTQPPQPFVKPYVPYIVPNPSEVTKNTDPVITNKQYVDKSVDFRKSKDYENALKSCGKIISYMGNIDNYGIGKVEGFNKLYLERKKQYVERSRSKERLFI